MGAMKVLIVGIIAKAVVILGVLGFTFAMYYVTHNLNMLWLLWLLLCAWLIPTYSYNTKESQNNKNEVGNANITRE